MSLAFIAVAVLAAALGKGAVGFGFPTLATPLLSLVVDVKTAVVVLILPNIVMDAILFGRRGAPWSTVRRLALLLAFGVGGTFVGTRLLATLSPRTATLILGGIILMFVGLQLTGVRPRVSVRWERWLAPGVGFLAGVVGGVTNVPGTPLAMYFVALGMEKYEFVRSVAFSFMVYKIVQLGAVAYYGLLTWPLLWASVGLTGVALGGFAVGLGVQDRLEPARFNRVVLVFLAALGAWLIVRAML